MDIALPNETYSVRVIKVGGKEMGLLLERPLYLDSTTSASSCWVASKRQFTGCDRGLAAATRMTLSNWVHTTLSSLWRLWLQIVVLI